MTSMTSDRIDALSVEDLCLACAQAADGLRKRRDLEQFSGMCFMSFEIDEFDPLLPPDYAHDMSAAWELVDWLREHRPGWRMALQAGEVSAAGAVWRCTFTARDGATVAATCASAPEAVSRAFLKVFHAV